jgi:hypothetical protein
VPPEPLAIGVARMRSDVHAAVDRSANSAPHYFG